VDPVTRLKLYWLPLGAGGSGLVRASGRTYERLEARREHRPPAAIYHSALRVLVDGTSHVVEVAPAWGNDERQRGVVATGPVGARWLGRSALFRYEVRCWADGRIPDEEYAVSSPIDIPTDPDCARQLLEVLRQVPTPVWGRDELGAGEMWNSNSVISWLLTSTDHWLPDLPVGGRAPGWQAGIEVARRGVAGGAHDPRRAVGGSAQ
jgi:hypothetical protein